MDQPATTAGRRERVKLVATCYMKNGMTLQAFCEIESGMTKDDAEKAKEKLMHCVNTEIKRGATGFFSLGDTTFVLAEISAYTVSVQE